MPLVIVTLLFEFSFHLAGTEVRQDFKTVLTMDCSRRLSIHYWQVSLQA